MDREYYMAKALDLAREAAEDGEVPVGCIILDKDNNIVGRGRNRREKCSDATAHAEIEAIREACSKLGDWRLDECSIYVTLEPCPMCTGAIINARVRRVFYGARDSVMGACGGVLNLFMENFPHHPQLVGGILGEECTAVLSEFFRKLRNQ